MNKFVTFLLALAVSGATLCAAQKAQSFEVLKDKSNFAKVELFEDEAVFANPQINIGVVKAYEENPSAYSDSELLPVAICYMTLRQPQRTLELLDKFMAYAPKNVRAIRTYATLILLEGKKDKALELYKKAYDLGDKEVVKSIASAYVYMGTPDAIAPYLPELETFAKDDLFPFSMVLIYAYRNPDAKDLNIAKRVIDALDAKKAMENAASDSLVTILNMYLSEKSVWKPEALIIPAKGAVISGHLGLAKEIYNSILEKNPNDTSALRGRAIVEFKLGGVMEAANLVKRAIDAGDKSAINDAMELAIVSKNGEVYKMFEPLFGGFDFNVQLRLTMLNFAANNDGNPEIFFMSLAGDNGELLLKEPTLKPVISEGLKKYSSDARSAKIREKLSGK